MYCGSRGLARRTKVRQLGVFENRPEILKSVVSRLSKGGRRLSLCYEAGFLAATDFTVCLTGYGHECAFVVAPPLIPMKAGDRVKTRSPRCADAGEAASGRRTDGNLDTRCRTRGDARSGAGAGDSMVRVLAKARQHLQGFLLRHERIYRGALRLDLGLSTLAVDGALLEHPAQQIVLQDYIHAVQEAENLDATGTDAANRVIELLPNWSMAPVVAALQSMRGPPS